jgi:hypothetical protein
MESPESGNESTDTACSESTTPEARPKITRAEASRQNGAKSRGPVTDAGKAASSQNALRHGEYATNLTLKFENDEAFIRILAALESQFPPQTEFEADLILTMAHARWRTVRMWSLEKSTLDQAIDTACANNTNPEAELMGLISTAHQQLTDTSGVLRMIDRCENRYQRIFSRTLKELLKIRADRRSEEDRESKREFKNAAPDGQIGNDAFGNPDALKNEITNPPTHAKSMFPVRPDYLAARQTPPHPASFEQQNRHLAPIGARIRQSASHPPLGPEAKPPAAH